MLIFRMCDINTKFIGHVQTSGAFLAEALLKIQVINIKTFIIHYMLLTIVAK